MKHNLLSIGTAVLALSSFSQAATITIGAGTYTENFNTLSTGTEIAPGWDFRRNATASSLGTTKRALLNFGGAFPWADAGGGAYNLSSGNIPQTSDTPTQAANPDRALGFGQVMTAGDPGAALNFDFSTTGVLFNSLTIDLLLLHNAGKSTTYSLQYGIGATPTSFVTLATWSDASIPSGWGKETLTFDRTDFGSALDEQSQAWFRVAVIDPATGSGNLYDVVGIDNLSITTSAVPEPSSMLLGCLGVLGLLRTRRR